ncbi:MAG: LCP family protein [Oscillospiraceae bacterium]|nr:LCP family protein [Oscillospiraceae bacterium]
MNNDRFSDTTELPVPRVPRQPQNQQPSDPFAEAARTNDTTYRSNPNPQRSTVDPNTGAPRRRLNGAAAPRQSEHTTGADSYAHHSGEHPPSASGSNPHRAPARPTASDGYPHRPSGRSGTQNGNPQRPSARQSAPNGYAQRQVQPAPRQRIRRDGANPPPQAAIRRASYQEQMPEDDQIYAYRQPQQVYRQPEFADEEIREPAPKKKKRRKRHRHSCLRKIITSLLTVAVVLFGLYSGVVLLAIKKLGYEETGARAITATAAEPDAAVRNVLLIGTDNREDERGRADTVILLSFSKHNHTVTMTSLMRDSYVNIPNHGTDKLNAAYAYGGATLLMDTITSNFGIPVDDYICVNFRAFVHIADAVGGLKVEISDREAEAINVILESEVNGIMGDDPKDDFLPSGGTFLLNGKQALAYARIRYVGNADFERTERQRTVLDLMLGKLKHLSPTAVPKILMKAVPELKTNMTTGELYLLSLQTPVKLIGYDMQKLRLPADGTYSDQTAPDGQMVLAVDFDANLQLYLKTIHDAQQPEPAEGEVTAP